MTTLTAGDASARRRAARLGSRPLTHFLQVVRLGIPRRVLSASFTRSGVDRSRAIPYSNHGVERETRLELATLTLARYASNSVFRRGQNWPLSHYLPPVSTGIHADHTGIHADHTGVHADPTPRLQAEASARDPRLQRSTIGSMASRGIGLPREPLTGRRALPFVALAAHTSGSPIDDIRFPWPASGSGRP
jgi:hypothetical protein